MLKCNPCQKAIHILLMGQQYKCGDLPVASFLDILTADVFTLGPLALLRCAESGTRPAKLTMPLPVTRFTTDDMLAVDMLDMFG